MYVPIDFTIIYKTKKMQYRDIWIIDLDIGTATDTMTLNLPHCEMVAIVRKKRHPEKK
jgi:hypothetical protein